jgi:DNA repair photolyase
VSIPFWNPVHARAIEPYVATPERRMKTVERLVRAGLRVSVNVAPVIPGLNDEDMVAVLEAAARAGAHSAFMCLVRLPGTVKEVFEERLRAALPLRADRVLARTRQVRSGKLNDPRFGSRQTGEGAYAESLSQLFARAAERLGLHGERLGASTPANSFERPRAQLELFSSGPTSCAPRS